LTISPNQPNAFIVARLNDVAPDGASTRVTYGVLNLTHRDSHEHPTELIPGKTYSIRLQLNDIAHSFPAGHRIRVALSNTFWPLLWPSPQPVALTLSTGASTLELPVRETQPGDASLPPFKQTESATPQLAETVDTGGYTRRIERDETTGTTTVTVVDDTGLTNLPKIGWQHGTVNRHYFSINDDDPNSARIHTHWTTRCNRPELSLNFRTETHTTLTSTPTEFKVEAKLEAYESDELVYSNSWSKTIDRYLN